jgi:hypothetical protein
MLQPTKNAGKSNHRCANQPQHHQTHVLYMPLCSAKPKQFPVNWFAYKTKKKYCIKVLPPESAVTYCQTERSEAQ